MNDIDDIRTEMGRLALIKLYLSQDNQQLTVAEIIQKIEIRLSELQTVEDMIKI